MATCLRLVQLSTGVDSIYVVDGGKVGDLAAVYVVDAAATDQSACAAVSLSGAEYRAIESVIASCGAGGTGECTGSFSFSAADGGLLSASIVGVWVAAYFVRSVINVVQSGVES